MSATQALKYLLITTILIAGLYLGRTLFVPMFFGLFVAMVMYPICKWMEQKRLGRSVSITISLSIVTCLFGSLIWLLMLETNTFAKDIPDIANRLKAIVPQLQQWLTINLSIDNSTQNDWLDNTLINARNNLGNGIGATVNMTISTIFMLFMVPIFAALFLYHRETFVQFIKNLAGERYQAITQLIIEQTVHTYFNYIKGMTMVYAIVGILNSIGLMLLGIRHAILFGMLTAIMTIIPYVGIIVSALLPISVALVTKTSLWYPFGVVAVFAIVQYLEANVIFPKVVGTQLNISTWATLVAVIAGGIIWGVAGMVLFIPFVAILKIITDHMPEYKAFNLLLNRDAGYQK